jgi:hypothetical protein
MVFLAHTGGGNEAPLTAKNLDAAEVDFVRTCGLTPERASALRTESDRNKVVGVETSIAAAILMPAGFFRRLAHGAPSAVTESAGLAIPATTAQESSAHPALPAA